ncbi:MAG: helix-turn-helix transcriptional regulator [Aeromonas sp.]
MHLPTLAHLIALNRSLPLSRLRTPRGLLVKRPPHEQRGQRMESNGTKARLIRVREVLARTGLSKSTLYRLLDSGAFPRRVSLGGRSIAFLEGEIDNWIAQCLAARNELRVIK